MGFLDSATKAVATAALAAKDKGGEIVDKVKLNASLSKEQRTLRNTYIEIGKEYVNSHADEAEGEMELLVKKVEDSKKNIEELEEKLSEVW